MAKKPENMSQGAPIFVGVDDGFACTDIVVMEGGKVTKTLAIASRARSGVHGTSVIGGDVGGIVPCYETEGVQFTVGELADAESARFNEYPFSAMNRAIVNHALRLAGLGGREVHIATGLPLSTFYKGDKPNSEVIERKRKSITTPVKAMDDGPMPIIVGHQVFPEGLAAWVDYAVGDDGNMRADADETVGVIDIGGRTTDVAVVLPGRRIDHARCGSADIGALNVVEAVRLSLQQSTGFDVGGAVIEKALRTRQLKMFGKVRDIGAEIDVAIAQSTDAVLREVNRRLGDGVDIDRILLVGGGAHLFKEVANRYPNVTIPESPEFANARGFAKYLSI
jgi:plasmid segregation protein ParM